MLNNQIYHAMMLNDIFTNTFWSAGIFSKEQLIFLLEDIKNTEFKLNYKNIFDIDVVASQVEKSIPLKNPDAFYQANLTSSGMDYGDKSNSLNATYMFNKIVFK